jgi:TRAP-type C4-dicarboxylate transport system substrate-binding protein
MHMLNRRFFSILCFAAAVIGSASAQQARIRLATLAPKGTSFDRLLHEMGEQWSKAPEGGAALIVYTDGNMGGEQEIVRRMRVGQLQAGLLTSDGLSMIDPSVKALEQIPLMYHSAAELDYVRSHMEDGIEKRMEDRGFVMLAWSMPGFARLFSKQPALHPQDFLRMKVTVGADDTREIQVLNSIGGHPVGLDWTNALTALQTGMVDSVTTLPVHALGAQFNTAVTNMLDLKWAPVSGGIIVTKKSWDALPSSTRTAMKQAALAAAAQMETASLAEDAAAVTAMQKHGMQVHAVSPEMEREWDQFAQTVLWPKIRGNIVDAAAFDEVQRLTQEYRRQSGGGI